MAVGEGDQRQNGGERLGGQDSSLIAQAGLAKFSQVSGQKLVMCLQGPLERSFLIALLLLPERLHLL